MVAVVVAAFVGLAILGALISPEGEPTATQTTPEASSAPAEASSRPPRPRRPRRPPKPAPKPKAPGLNQPVSDGDFTFTVTVG